MIYSLYFIFSINTPCHEGKNQVEMASKMLLNKLSKERIYGQAETHHSLLNLPLTICSENMIPIRISGWIKIIEILTEESQHKSNADFFLRYCNRQECFDMSLWKYFTHCHIKENNNILHIPYAVGLYSKPIYPVTSNYARASIIKRHPWSRNQLLNIDIDEISLHKFESFLQNKYLCPKHLKMEYRRIQAQYFNSFVQKESTNNNFEALNQNNDQVYDQNVDTETLTLLNEMNSFTRMMKHSFEYNGFDYDIGLHFNWDERLSNRDANLKGETWLVEQLKIEENERNNNNHTITLPMKFDKSGYKLDELTNDQCKISYATMNKIME